MSGNFGDFNNDGYLDLALGNGSPKLDRLDPMVIFENDGTRFRFCECHQNSPGKRFGENRLFKCQFEGKRRCVLRIARPRQNQTE